jgi:hypothetical protein
MISQILMAGMMSVSMNFWSDVSNLVHGCSEQVMIRMPNGISETGELVSVCHDLVVQGNEVRVAPTVKEQ